MWPNPMEYPTTHVLVDNDINYLRGISTILPCDNKIYRYFTNAEEALSWINEIGDRNQAFGTFSKRQFGELNNSCVAFEISNIHGLIFKQDRFNTISTVLVDYDMPGMNGLELCRSINNPNIQKILLTGFLGEKEARNALNKGWIDMFLPKGEDSAQKISELIADSDHNYFKESNGFISAAIRTNRQAQVLESPVVKDFLYNIYVACAGVEYYMLSDDGDYLFVDAKGITTGISIQDAERRKEHIELAHELSVSKEILYRLKKGQALFCHFGDSLPEGSLWKNYIFPSTLIDQQTGLLGAADKQMFSNGFSRITSFQTTFDGSIQDAIRILN